MQARARVTFAIAAWPLSMRFWWFLLWSDSPYAQIYASTFPPRSEPVDLWPFSGFLSQATLDLLGLDALPEFLDHRPQDESIPPAIRPLRAVRSGDGCATSSALPRIDTIFPGTRKSIPAPRTRVAQAACSIGTFTCRPSPTPRRSRREGRRCDCGTTTKS